LLVSDDGEVLSGFAIGDGVDATNIDNGQAFASYREGTLTVASETSPSVFVIVETES
jgi:hypothetical protein